MPIISTLVVAGIGIAIGRRLFGPDAERSDDGPPMEGHPPQRTAPVEGDARTRSPESALERRYQRFFADRIDPLFGAARADAINAYEGLAGEKSERTRAINRNFGFSGALTAVALATVGVNPAVRMALTVPPAAYLIWRRYHHVADAAAEGQRSQNMAILSVANLGLVWLGGYYVIGGAILSLACFGDKLHNLSERRMHSQVSMAFRPADGMVRRVVDGRFEDVEARCLTAGDIIVIVGGQALPADGVVVSGHGLVDQSWLTGESRPIDVAAGDDVFAATTLLDGEIRLEITCAGDETAIARIGHLLQTMSADQSTIMSRAARLADASIVPTVGAIALAGLTVGFQGMVAIGMTVFGLNLDFNGPIAMLSHVNEAAMRGVLFKDGLSLEQLSEVDLVIFDKTGVLTEPRIGVVDVIPHGAVDADTLLALAAAVEHDQPHPVAGAIRSAADARGLARPAPRQLESRLGHGVAADVGRRRVAVGNRRWMSVLGVPMPDRPAPADGLTRIFVAIDGRLAGEIGLDAPLRAEAPDVVADLKRRGLEVAIVSGDEPGATARVADALGVDWFVGGALPEDKAALVTRLGEEQGRRALFIGDGINDAVALKAAWVSASLGGASEVATTVARVVLLDGTLKALPDVFDMGQRFRATMRDLSVLSIVPCAAIWGAVFFAHLGVVGAAALFEASLWVGAGRAMAPRLGLSGPKAPEPDGPEPEDRRSGT